VRVEAWNSFAVPAATASTAAGSLGNWFVSVPVSFGATTITATSSSRRSTGYVQTNVSNVLTPRHELAERER
jgi:hypothetical protein